MSSLIVDVTLPTGTYEASGPQQAAVEWPPHPYRLFAALVAAAGAGRTAEEDACLRMLEALPPPLVHAAGRWSVTQAHTVWVPSAVGHARAGRLSDRAVVPEVGQVRFEWEAVSPAFPVSALDRLAGRIGYLGRAGSLAIVTASLASTPLPLGMAIWAPGGGSSADQLRVPYRGLLDELDGAYGARLDATTRRPAPTRSYQRVDRTAEEVATGPWDRLGIWRVGGQIPGTYALSLCDDLRRAALAAEGDACPSEISGHSVPGEKFDAPHVAWVPIVDVGHPHATGHIMGLAAALPPGVRLPRLPRQVALAGAMHELAPVDESRRVPFGLTEARWAGTSAVWATATPVALPWSDERRSPRAQQRAVAAACRKAGYPEPVEVVTDDVPFIPGPALASAHMRARRAGSTRRACHAMVRFDRPVRGPVVIGPWRHFGLGLMVPADCEAACASREPGAAA